MPFWIKNWFYRFKYTFIKLPEEVLVQTSVGCEFCGSGVLRIRPYDRQLTCLQCTRLDLLFDTVADAKKAAIENIWQPAQSGKAI